MYNLDTLSVTMGTKSEDIRLQINDVKYKKGDGILYLMAERLGWMPHAKNNFTISHKYSDIKMQKISPEGKPKIQLQIVLHTGDSTTFQFSNLEDRTAAKDALLLILPQFKGKMPKDREKKAMYLSQNPHLLQLYKDLVETKVISAEDFWTQFGNDHSHIGFINEPQQEVQEIGISPDFFSGIPLNGKQITGKINAETLWAILKTYPRIAKKHQEQVPAKMSEQEFWNKFFQSRYFNRDRGKDMFTDCAKSDEKEWNSQVKAGVSDPFLNLDVFNDNPYQANSDELPQTSSHDNTDHQALIKKFNQQSVRLLDTLTSKHDMLMRVDHRSIGNNSQDSTKQEQASQDSGPIQSQVQPVVAGDKLDVSTATNSTSSIAKETSASFRANRRDLTYDDLAGHDNLGDFLDPESRVSSREVDRERYTIVAQSGQSAIRSSDVKDHISLLNIWEPNLVNCVNPKDATEALKNLSPAGCMMRSANSNRLEDSVAEDVQVKLKSLYSASNELLRHFWLCFPVLDTSLENKLIKLYDTLKKFESTKLQPFHDSLSRDQRHLLNHIMRAQFKPAYRKYDSWKSKRRHLETTGLKTINS